MSHIATTWDYSLPHTKNLLQIFLLQIFCVWQGIKILHDESLHAIGKRSEAIIYERGLLYKIDATAPAKRFRVALHIGSCYLHICCA